MPISPFLVLPLLVACAASKPAAPERSFEDVSVLKNEARQLAQRRDVEGAIAKLEQATQLAPDDVEAHGLLGVAYGHAGNDAAAEAEFRSASALDPEDPRPYGFLGALYLKQARFGEAEAAFRQVLLLDPEQTNAYGFLGQIGAQSGNYGLCVEGFDAFTAAVEKKNADLLTEAEKQRYQEAKSRVRLCHSKLDRGTP